MYAMAEKLMEDKDFNAVAIKFNDNPNHFICTEALKLFFNAKDGAVAAQALEILRKAAQE